MSAPKVIPPLPYEGDVIVFTPRCPECEYSLVGLPEGPCPECGTPFTLKQLGELERNRRSHGWGEAVAAACLLALELVCVGSGFYSMAARRDFDRIGVPFTGCIIMSILWLLFRPPALRRERIHEVIWLALPLGSLAALVCSHYGVGFLIVPCFALLLSTLACLLRRAADRDEVRARVWFMVAGYLSVAAIVGILDFVKRYRAGQQWTDWADPRPGPSHDQYPLNAQEFGWIVVVLTVAAGVCVPVFIRYAWRVYRKHRWIHSASDPAPTPEVPTPKI